MSNSVQQYSLLCQRIAADCINLSEDVPERSLKLHFLRMADVWTELAEHPRVLH